MNKGIYQADGRLWADWPKPKKSDYYDPHPAAENEGGFALVGYYSDHEKWESRPSIPVHPDLKKVWEAGKLYYCDKDYQIYVGPPDEWQPTYNNPDDPPIITEAVPIPAKRTKTINMDQKINTLAEHIQEDCHKMVETIMSRNKTISYQDATNVFIFRKLAELILKIK
jgi:hypothetical protein